ncbi:MAG: oligoribonuclease, partial [Myxococcota bacterium]
HDNRLVWMDMEMTGLNPDTCAIIQVALILTDRDLNEIADPLDLTIWQPDSALETMNPFVRDMHTKNGLLEKVRRSDIDLEEAQEQLMEVLSKHCVYKTGRLAGNSVYQDRRFLTRYMPTVENFLHYRQVDVSCIKELAHAWYNVKYRKPEDGAHTALHDTRQSIAELKFYREQVFRSQP